MKKILCFIDRQQNYTGELEEFIQKLDEAGYAVYLFTDILNQENTPSDILLTLDSLVEKKECEEEYTFLSNIKNLTQVVYRIYHQTFHHFIYLHQKQAGNFHLDGIYQELLTMKVLEREVLYKPVFTNAAEFDILNYNTNTVKAASFISGGSTTNENKISEGTPVSPRGYDTGELNEHPLIRKYYMVKGSCYLFEPVLSDKAVMISDKTAIISDKTVNIADRTVITGKDRTIRDKTGIVSDEPINAHKKQEKDKSFQHPGFSNMHYMYSYDENMISRLLSLLENLNYKSMGDIYDILDFMEKEMDGYQPYLFNMTCCILDDLSLFHNGKDILRALLLLSFLMQVTRRPYYLNRYLEYAIHSDMLFCENRFFLWNQAKRYLLANRACSDSYTNALMKELYQKTYYEYAEQLEEELTPIPLQERNQDTIAVFTVQFLSERHAPTRTTLERCYTLAKPLGKHILLINTREQLTRKGMLLLYAPTLGNVMEEYNDLDHYQYKDCSIPYYQPKDNMPSIEELKRIFHKIRELKPSFIFSIGTGSITADLCGKMVPEASIGVVFSALPTTMATFSVIGKKLSELEWEGYIKDGYSRESIIESTFTFELLPKKKTFTREEFEIPSHSFVLVTVGIRLDMEIDDEFMETINKTFNWGTHMVFAGYFERYQSYCDRYPDFKKHSTFIGYCDDMLALMELCDLYVNPRRFGGGFSIIEAFHEGKPGVTINYGDISIAAGDQFTVKNYQEMTEIIKRYMEDEEFYHSMSQKALEREKVVTDSASAMKEIIGKIQSSPLFFLHRRKINIDL